MKTLLLTMCLLAVPSGERERGIEHYRAGRYAEAVAEFRAAIEHDPEAADLQWNLALAAWRAGDLETAELALERYAASDKNADVALHRGLLGAIRFAEAEQLEHQADGAGAAMQTPGAVPMATGDVEPPADPLPLVERALQKAVQAKLQFVRAARSKPTAEALRNTERAVRKIDELKKRLEELQKQRQPQDPEDGEKSDGQNKDDEQKSDGDEPDQKKPDQKNADEQKPDDKQPSGEEKPGESGSQQQQPEPNPDEHEGSEPPEPQPDQPSPEASKPDESKSDQATPDEKSLREGESQPSPDLPSQGEPKPEDESENALPLPELSPEEMQRLLEKSKDLDKQMREVRRRLRRGRPRVERDW